MPPDRELVVLGQTIRQIRQEQSLSIGQLAGIIGVPRSRLEALEAGRLDPRYDLLLDLADGLGIRPTDIVIRWEERMAKP